MERGSNVDIRVEVTPDPGRTLRGLRQLRRRKLWAYRVYGAFCLLVGLLLLAVPGQTGWTVVLIALGATVAVLPDLVLVRAVRRHARLGTGPSLIEITDERVRSSNPIAGGEFSWRAVDRVSENDEFWFLRLASRQTIILPKQVFGSGQQETLRHFLVGRGLVAAKSAA
jgi:hypothetical protein